MSSTSTVTGVIEVVLAISILSQPLTQLPEYHAGSVALERSDADPFESINRRSYRLNEQIDKAVTHPIISSYQHVVPNFLRGGIHNIISNLDEPNVFLNDVIQIRPMSAGKAAIRFAVNSTVGLLGAVDVADRLKTPHHDNGFALTLGRYGVGAGPYLFFPVLGPSTARNTVGSVLDFVLDPVNQLRHVHSEAIEASQTLVDLINSPAKSALNLMDMRSSADGDITDLSNGSTDPYATLRSVYLQQVRVSIGGDASSFGNSPDIPDIPAEEPPPKPADPQTDGVKPTPVDANAPKA